MAIMAAISPITVLATNGQNPITNPLGGTLDSTKAVEITWKPTTQGTISLVLLKGPPSNLWEVGPIVSNIKNTGSYTWWIDNSLQDSGAMQEGYKYGLKIIDDPSGTFEYSPPFNIAVKDSQYGKPPPMPSSTPAAAHSNTPTKTPSTDSESSNASPSKTSPSPTTLYTSTRSATPKPTPSESSSSSGTKKSNPDSDSDKPSLPRSPSSNNPGKPDSTPSASKSDTDSWNGWFFLF
ncbi:hypothetical protein RUND412_002702 [Rhizina undulata]